MRIIKSLLLLSSFFLFDFLFASNIKVGAQVVIDGPGGNKLKQSGTGIRFETGSVDPMWGGTGEYTFQTYFVDPEGGEPEFVKIYITRSGKENFENHLMQKGVATANGTAYFFKKIISEKDAGIYQFYFEAKVGDRLIHGPSYWGENCKPGGCGECCGVWGGPKILSSKLIEENKIYFFEKEKKNPLVVYDVGKNWITSVDISSDEKYFAAADNNQTVYLFDIPQKKLKWKYTSDFVADTGNLGMDKGLVSFSDNGYLAVSLKGVVFLFDINRDKPIWSFPTGAVLNGLAISGDAKYIAAGGRDTYVYFWEKDNSNPVWRHKIEATGGMMGGSVIRSLSMTVDGSYFVVGTSCPDRSIHVFTPKSSIPVFEAKVGVNFPVESVSITKDGQYILAGGGGSPEDPYSAVLYKLKQLKPVWNFDASVNPVNEVVISSDGQYCAAGSILEGIFVNRCDDKNPLWRAKDTGYIGSLSFSDDGGYLGAGTGTNHVLLLSIPNRKIINDWETAGKAESSAISSSGRYIAAGTGLNRFFIISGEGTNSSGANEMAFKNEKPEIVSVGAFNSPDSGLKPNGIFEKIKAWFIKTFSSFFHSKDKKQDKIKSCGNGLCEPDLGETIENCIGDCTPSE